MGGLSLQITKKQTCHKIVCQLDDFMGYGTYHGDSVPAA